MNHSAMSGDYTDLRFVKSRKVCLITIEIPIEQAAAFVAAFGTPNPASGCPVALARLDPKTIAAKPDEPVKERKRFADLSLSQQAGIRCADPDFWEFLSTRTTGGVASSEDAARRVRSLCVVLSRADLNTTPDGAKRWGKLEDDYQLWRMGART